MGKFFSAVISKEYKETGDFERRMKKFRKRKVDARTDLIIFWAVA